MKITVEFKAATVDNDAFQTLIGISRAIAAKSQNREVLRNLLLPTVHNIDSVIDAIIATKDYTGDITVDCDNWSYVAGFTINKK